MPSHDRPDDFVDGMEREADQRLERFAAQALKYLGEVSGATTLIMRIWEPQDQRTVLHTKASNEQGTWRFSVQPDQLTSTSTRPVSGPRPRRCSYTLKLQFWYHLDLPHRWNGALGIEYSGIRFLSGNEEAQLRSEIGILSKNLTIRLTDSEIAQLKRQLNEERKFSAKSGEFVASLSK